MLSGRPSLASFLASHPLPTHTFSQSSNASSAPCPWAWHRSFHHSNPCFRIGFWISFHPPFSLYVPPILLLASTSNAFLDLTTTTLVQAANICARTTAETFLSMSLLPWPFYSLLPTQQRCRLKSVRNLVSLLLRTLHCFPHPRGERFPFLPIDGMCASSGNPLC